MSSPQLDLIFGALSDATRRGILAQLAQGETNIVTLAAPYEMSQPAFSKHVRVLEKAGLIERSRRGREHWLRVNPVMAEQARDWLDYYAQFWREQFDDVETYLRQRGQLK